MKHGFIKVAAVTPKIRVADTKYNAQAICEKIEEAWERGAKVVVFPQLCLTGCTCGDLFWQDVLLEGAKQALLQVAKSTEGKDAIVFVGLPLEKEGRLYNVAAALQDGEILGLVPKTNVSNGADAQEGRYFTEGPGTVTGFFLEGEEIPFGANLLFSCETVPGLVLAAELGEDLEMPTSPGADHALMGATVIVNPAASCEAAAGGEYRELLVRSASARQLCGYVYVSAGEGESTQDLVFAGAKLIAENGEILNQSESFGAEIVYGDVDVQRIASRRRKMTGFGQEPALAYTVVPFDLECRDTKLERSFAPMPFVPKEEQERARRCQEILSIQAHGLKKRLEHTGAKEAVLGISGGLDSTLALLVTVKAFDLLGWDRSRILAVTMPGFGTTDRTYDNACKLVNTLGATLREVDIRAAVIQHFQDIGQDINCHDVTYENSQARERTQVLMDLANQKGGLVIGTGDLSELALGWATYNGDHMSMYGVNAGVPKTLVRHLVKYYADVCKDQELAQVLLDVLDTPVSPELLPPVEGQIAQKTEDLVGPYELHDFFLYYMLRWGYSPGKLYRMAKASFAGVHEDAVILKWLKVFCRRFFSQQFKRSCLPDGPKVGSVGLSPRGDWRMPSDASAALWLAEAEELEA